MDRQGEQAYYFKRVTLPSGKAIEVLYFGEPEEEKAQAQLEAPSEAAAPEPAPSEAQPALHICTECDAHLVYPAGWEEAGHHSWRVTLICPNCGNERRDVFSDDAVEALDEALDRGTDSLASDYKTLVRANMADEVERFVAALKADAIQPMDF